VTKTQTYGDGVIIELLYMQCRCMGIGLCPMQT